MGMRGSVVGKLFQDRPLAGVLSEWIPNIFTMRRYSLLRKIGVVSPGEGLIPRSRPTPVDARYDDPLTIKKVRPGMIVFDGFLNGEE